MNRTAAASSLGSVWLLPLVVLFVASEVRAQETTDAQNLVYVEVFGNALFLGSVNYERKLTPQLAVRLGASPFGGFPMMVTYLPGQEDHSAEVGLGVLAGASDEDVLGTGTLGYRYQPREGRIVFRAGWTPLIGTAGVATWAGISLGFAF